MDSIPDQFALSLRTWPSSNNEAGALRSQISRIHTQRGNFRNISEEILEKEINAEETDVTAKEDEASSEDEEEEKADPTKDLNAAKEQMVQSVAQALSSSQTALDFVSLLLSKFNPNTAASMSEYLKNPSSEYNVPIGTVGADKIESARHTDAQKLESKRVAKGWKILSLNKSVDSILDAATRLEQEMEVEAKYWEDILAIKEKGWAVCYATPTSRYERQTKRFDGTLAVRFGFSESAPEFHNRGLAILRRTDDGSIALGTDVLQTNPKHLHVSIQTDGVGIGHSEFSLFSDLDASLQSQVLKARNAIFEQELWHELLRESRHLVSYGAVIHDSAISIPLSSTKTVLLKFTSEPEESSSPPNEDDKLANTIAVAIHLLLTHSHRQRLRQRSQPPPPISQENKYGANTHPTCTLLRPVIAHLYHQASISSLHSILSPISDILAKAGLTSNYNIIQKPSSRPETQANRYLYAPQSVSEKVIVSLSENIEGEATLSFKDNGGDQKEKTFKIQFRTILFPAATTQYRVLGASDAYKAASVFASINEVREYVLFAVTCAIAEFFVKSPIQNQEFEQNGAEEQRNGDIPNHTPEPQARGWQVTVHSNIIRESIPQTNEVREVSFSFETIEKDASFLALALKGRELKKGLFPPNEMDMKLGLRAERKYKFDDEVGESGNRRTGGTAVWVWWVGGEERSLREFVEDKKVSEGEGSIETVPIRLPKD